MQMRPKQEGDDHYQTSYMSSLRQNPRIVRVSRAFGGKDRHSKVCTVRGLRDRRIRLSAVTAIQLYDLQDRLGLSQPSKVIDWLLQAAKNDVDLLSPLRFPPGFHPNLIADAGESYPGLFDPEPASNISQICIGHTKMLGRHYFDPASCSLKTDTIQRESLDLEQRVWDKTDESSNLVHGFDIDHHFFSNPSQSNRLCFPTSSTYNSSSSYNYNLGHLQQSLVDQSGNVTVAFSNNNLNPSATETMSSTFPRYPSFLNGGQLQLFSSNSNTSKQTDHV